MERETRVAWYVKLRHCESLASAAIIKYHVTADQEKCCVCVCVCVSI
jgi:hypothetical protein